MAFSPGPPGLGAPASGLVRELGGPGQAEGCVLQSSRALAMAAHWLGPGHDLMAEAVSMGPSQWRPQHLEYMDTATKVTASISFSLSIQVLKIGTA